MIIVIFVCHNVTILMQKCIVLMYLMKISFYVNIRVQFFSKYTLIQLIIYIINLEIIVQKVHSRVQSSILFFSKES